jgi:hypothetical protein
VVSVAEDMMSTHTHLHVMYTKRYSYLMTLMACGRKITANRRNLPAKCDKKEFFEIGESGGSKFMSKIIFFRSDSE